MSSSNNHSELEFNPAVAGENPGIFCRSGEKVRRPVAVIAGEDGVRRNASPLWWK